MDSKIPKNPKKVFIGSLPGTTTDMDLKKYFSEFGEVFKIDVKYNRRPPKICSGFGVITVSEDTADKILAQKEHRLLNRVVDCKKYMSGKELNQQTKQFERRRVFIRNIPRSFSDEDLKSIFRSFGNIERGFIIRDSKKIGKKQNLYGFVIFKNEISAEKALEQKYVYDKASDIKMSITKFEKGQKKKKSKKNKKNKNFERKFEKNENLEKNKNFKDFREFKDFRNFDDFRDLGDFDDYDDFSYEKKNSAQKNFNINSSEYLFIQNFNNFGSKINRNLGLFDRENYANFNKINSRADIFGANHSRAEISNKKSTNYKNKNIYYLHDCFPASFSKHREHPYQQDHSDPEDNFYNQARPYGQQLSQFTTKNFPSYNLEVYKMDRKDDPNLRFNYYTTTSNNDDYMNHKIEKRLKNFT